MSKTGMSGWLLGTLPATVIVVLAGLWLLAPDAFAGSLALRGSFLALSLSCGVALTSLLLSQKRDEQKSVERCVDLLCRLDPHDPAHDPDTRDLPLLPANHPWCGIFNRLRECLLSSCRRLEEAEHGRASAEVRLKRLTDERNHVNEVLACLSDPVLAIDSFDELVLANPSAERLLGIDREATGKRALANLVQCESLVELLIDTRRHRKATHRTGEVAIEDATGQQRWYRADCTALAKADGGDAEQKPPLGAVAILSDISGEKAIQRRHAEFVSSVSHEMETPLAGIKAYVELLADGDAEDEQTREELLDVITAQADRLQRLIDNLLNLARIEAGVVEVNKQLHSLNELLEEAAEQVRPAAEEKGITFQREFSPMYPGTLVDRDMILQAAINLLSNAIEYTPQGGRVTLRSRMEDHDATFEVEDTGVGLSDEDRQRLFEKFYCVKKDSQMASGAGLRLPLARHIIEDVHGGQLSVESEPGKGSVFRVTLP